MKKTLFPSIAFALFASLSCEKDPLKDFNFQLSPELLEYTAMIELIDPAALGQIPQNATIRFVGDQASSIYTIAGTKDFIFEEGKLAIGVDPDALPDNSSVEVTAIVEADGYLTSRTLLQFGALKQQLITIPLLQTNQLPNGVGFLQSSVALTNNTLPTSHTFSLNASGTKNQAIQLELPAGTQFFNSSGQMINGSTLEAQIAGFDTDDSESMANYPVGLIAPSAMTPSGSTQDISFTSAGFAAIDLFVDGQEVTSFSQPVSLTMELDANLTNPQTGLPIAAGDAIEIWSYDETEEQWVYEQTGLVASGPGGLQMSFTTDHLSWWNVDFFGINCSVSSPLTVNINGGSGNYVVKMVNALNPAQSYSTTTQYLYDGLSITFYNVPDFDVILELYASYSDAYSGNNPLAVSSPFNICDGATSISFNLPPANPLITLDIEGYCEDVSGLVIRPSFYVYYRPTGSTYWMYLGWVANGMGQTDLLAQGQTYDFAVWYDGWIEANGNLIDQTTYAFSFELGDFCDNL